MEKHGMVSETPVTSLSPVMCNNISERSTFQEFHHYPEFIADQITAIHLHNVSVVIVTHYDNL